MTPEVGVKGRGKGATIWVPGEFKERVKAHAQKQGKAEWKVLLDALALYETSLRKPRAKEELPVVDKVVWYVQKLAMSIGELKANPTEENLQRTMKTIQQIKERLGVDTALLERALTDYIRLLKGNRKEREDEVEARMEVNMALKSVLIEIVFKWILKEELPSQSASQSGSQAGEA
jgi:response regulator RpfG family c-di-GMP phosphodiesterase